MNSEHDETAESLMTAASEAGYRVSRVMLKKWHTIGLLPRPSQRSRGRGRGTETVYPPGSTRQLLRVLEMRAEGGRFDPERALWRLWWEGWPVDVVRLRATLGETLSSWEVAIATLEDESNVIDRFADVRLPPVLARARKRAGTDAMPTVAALLLYAMRGEAPAHWQDDDDATALLRAIGLESAIRLMAPDSRRFVAELAGTLHQFGCAVAPPNLRSALDANDCDFTTARDDVRAIARLARLGYGVVAPLLSRSNTARDLAGQSTDEALEMLPGAVLVALALRRNPTYVAMLDVLQPAHAVISMLASAIEYDALTDTQMLPRRLAPSGSVANGEEPSTCAPSLAP